MRKKVHEVTLKVTKERTSPESKSFQKKLFE